MAVLGQLGIWRHGVVAATVLGGSALALTGVIGQERIEESFESKQVTITPTADDGLRIREVVDQDFGSHDRHGYERIIPNDFGVPTDVEASSPDAPAPVDVDALGDETRIRIGDPDTTVSGQHRYVLTYTLPDANLTSGELALDIIGTEETLATERMEVVVTGLDLADPRCNVGAFGTSGGCTLEPDGATYRAVISPLEPSDGVTIGGTITGRREPVEVAAPPLPERRSENTVPLAVAMIPLGALSAGGVYAWARRRGRNEVYAGGAADAAFGSSAPFPPPGSPPPAVRLVPDQDMDELATTEFVPPKGIEPWQGAVLLSEKIDDATVSAWFSGQAARDAITISKDGDDDVILGIGPRLTQADGTDQSILRQLFDGSASITLDGYDKGFATAWRAVRAEQERSISTSGYWKRLPPSAGGCSLRLSLPLVIVAGVWLLVGAGSLVTALLGWVAGPIGALVFGLVVPALAAYAMYRSLLPARTAAGSALTLRTESFRRFLAASEGRHVEWAWQHGLLREYSAWAVALGAASTWERAMEASSVPPTELATGPLLVYSMGPSFAGGHTPPSSHGSGSGGFSGGGFSGGSVGGGGGGGSSGSW